MKHSRKTRAFTLVEVLITLAIIVVVALVAYLNLQGGKSNEDLVTTSQQLSAVLREAQQSAASHEGGGVWGVYLSGATSSPPFYALISSSTYSSSTVVQKYSLPSSVSFVTSTLPGASSLTVVFTPVTGVSSISTTLSLYSVEQPTLIEDVAVTGPGHVEYYPAPPPLQTGVWIPVPGNPTFGTSDFSVMKYTAGCSDGLDDALNPPAAENGTLGTYDEYNVPCISANSSQIASLPNAWPVVSLAQASSSLLCAGIGAHLLTNAEWQTIAWNVEQVASNWSGGTVGNGMMYIGHNDNSPANAQFATSTDADGYYGTDGPTSGGGTGTGGATADDQRRTLTLSNGSVIWDFGGNVWEWLADDILGENEPYGTSTPSAGWQFPEISNWGTLSAQLVGPENTSWTTAQGIGFDSSWFGDSSTTLYGFIRGGDWQTNPIYGCGANCESGVETISLQTPATAYWWNNLGFRCAK